jgi:hypothetical protein
VTLLAAATVLLLITGHLRLRWSAVVAGLALAAAALVPWALAVAREPALLPVSEGFPFRGLLLLFPLVRGVLYWLRHGSLGLPGPEARFDFEPALGDSLARPVEVFADAMVSGVGAITVIVPLLANLWLWRRLRRRGLGEMLGVQEGRRAWVAGYVRVCFVAALLTYAAAPTTVMWWQGVALLHAALIPVALWAGAVMRKRRRVARSGSWSWATCAVLIAVLLAFGGRRHRCGGEDSIVLPLRGDHPMLHDLRIFESCPFESRPDGWWPDVLPEPRLPRSGSAQPPVRSPAVAGTSASSVPVASTRPGGAGGMLPTTGRGGNSPGSSFGGGGGGGSCAATRKLPASPAVSSRNVSVPATALLKSRMLPSASLRVVTKA